MSSLLMIPIPPVKLARRAWLRVFGLLFLGLGGTAALLFYGHQLRRLEGALKTYQEATAQFSARTEAIHRLSDMEAAFNRYLLDSNSANLGLLQSDKQRIEQLAQWDANTQNDQLLQNLVAAEQKWYSQIVQPLIEERRKLAAGQGLPEDFLTKYRAAQQDLQIINLEMATENAYHQAQQSFQQTENETRWLWLPYPLAGLLIIAIVWLGISTVKSVNHLKQAAESEDEEDAEDDNGKEMAHEEETGKK